MITRSTHLSTYNDCPRKFWFEYGPTGKPRPASAAQLVGTALHHELEAYARGITPQELPYDGNDPEALELHIPAEGWSPLALGAIPVLARELEGREILGIEERFTGVELAPGLELTGTVDLILHQPGCYDCSPRSLSPDCPTCEGLGTIIIHDHKTTSDWKWAKTAEELRTNLQLLTYANVAIRHIRRDYGCKVVRLQHLAVNKKQCQARLTYVDLSREEVLSKFSSIVALAISSRRDYNLSVADVEPVRSVCGKYAGCPHEGICTLYPYSNGEKTMASFLALIGKTKSDLVQTPAPTVAKTSEPEPETVQAAAPSFAGLISPPDRQPELEPTAPADRPLESLQTITPKIGEGLAGAGIDTAQDLANYAANHGLETINGIGSKRASAILEELTALQVHPTEPTAPTEGAAPTEPTEGAKATDIVLVIDAAVTFTTLKNYEPWQEQAVHDAVKAIEAKHKVSNFLLAPYAKGVNDLTAWAYTHRWPSGIYEVNTLHPVDKCCLPALLEIADTVIQG